MPESTTPEPQRPLGWREREALRQSIDEDIVKMQITKAMVTGVGTICWDDERAKRGYPKDA